MVVELGFMNTNSFLIFFFERVKHVLSCFFLIADFEFDNSHIDRHISWTEQKPNNNIGKFIFFCL